jgi:hypothetical protein
MKPISFVGPLLTKIFHYCSICRDKKLLEYVVVFERDMRIIAV